VNKWAFIDCSEEINLHNIDFSDYEKVVIVTSGDITIPLGSTHPLLELKLVTVEAFTQEQVDHALTFNLSKYDSIAKKTIRFDVYSNHLYLTKVDGLLKASNRACHIFELPPYETITPEQALDNLLSILKNFSDKRTRPRSIEGLIWLLKNDWRTLRGRVETSFLLKKMKSQGMIGYASNGIHFLI